MPDRDHAVTTCHSCGSQLPARRPAVHACDWWRWLDHQVDLRREELDRFERELGAYLRSPDGQFDLWYAAHQRLQQKLPGDP
ncbi:MAG TPA: hypothetical protein VI409_09500 [Gaiellaceae bacterium]|nr:hypothetical protein [Gaiellaceae bacterium]